LKLPLLDVWDDTEVPRSGPENMAIDEGLLDQALISGENSSCLRFYRWDGDWWSVGYFQRSEMQQLQEEGHRVVRRRSGGGAVLHDAEEETYALVLPSAMLLGAKELYRAVHEALASAICDVGGEAMLTDVSGAGRPGKCFEQPVAADVIHPVTGQKLAGAAQRRSRGAVLHQGSVRVPLDIRGRWRSPFIERLAERSQLSNEGEFLLDPAEIQRRL